MTEKEIRLDQTKKVFEVLAKLISEKEGCTYRALIYDLLGFTVEDGAYMELLEGMTITNFLVDVEDMREELNNLREEDWAWHQVLKMQNAREYRSKFLKDFQREYSTSTYPDYDEIYKRYDKMKLKNEKLARQVEIMERYLELIYDLGYDYDGFNDVENLKGLIDEMCRLASLGRACNVTEPIYEDDKGMKSNILGEIILKGDKDE